MAAVVIMAALAFGSVQSTAALWRNVATGQNAATIKTGKLELTAGSSAVQSTAYPFTELKPANLIQTGDFVQRPLLIKNGGTIPLKFRLGNAKVSFTAAGTGTVHLDLVRVANASACPETGTLPTGSATLLNADVATSTPVTGALPWLSLAALETTTICVRSTLVQAPKAQIKYTHLFSFQAQQAKNNP